MLQKACELRIHFYSTVLYSFSTCGYLHGVCMCIGFSYIRAIQMTKIHKTKISMAMFAKIENCANSSQGQSQWAIRHQTNGNSFKYTTALYLLLLSMASFVWLAMVCPPICGIANGTEHFFGSFYAGIARKLNSE